MTGRVARAGPTSAAAASAASWHVSLSSDPVIDYRTVAQEDRVVVVDVTEVAEVADGFAGMVANPHARPVDNPGVGVACLDADGQLERVFDGYASRNEIEGGGSSSFSVWAFERDGVSCTGMLAGAAAFQW